jgi:endonuclease
MTIYDKSTVELMRLYVDQRPDQDQFTADEIIAWFTIHWPKIKLGTVRAHLTQMSTNVPSRANWQVRPEHDLFFRISPGLFRRYRPDNDPPPIYRNSTPAAIRNEMIDGEDGVDGEEVSSQQSAIFAYESHLRDYLADNLDLLAVAQDGSLVVVELKVSKGHDHTIGQILTYMGWVRQDLADGKPVRGMIVAHTLSDELLTAAQEAKANIRLYEYDISFRVRPKG